jgi:putative hemolysin
MSPLVILSIVVVCLLGSFFFSGIETGILAFNRVRLRAMVRKKDRRALILARALEHPDRFLATSLVGNTIVNTIAATLVGYLLLEPNPRWGGWAAFLVMASVLYVICELVPKSLFRQFPTRLSVAMADLLNAASIVLLPVVWVFSLLTSVLLRTFGETKPREQIFVTREELKRLVLDSEAGGEVTPEERRMIDEVFNLRHITLDQIMTPMKQVATVLATGTAAEIVRSSRDSGYSRLPALGADGSIAGVISVYDVLFDAEPTANKTARQYLRRAHTFPAQTPIDEAMQRLRATQQPLAIVVDKSQRPAGIVTIEDMLVKLIGEIEG